MFDSFARLARKGLGAKLAVLAAATAMTAGVAQADTYPDRPIRMVVSYPAGGGIDVIARLLAQAMSTELKQSVIVENKGGAAGMIGTESVVRARADGYTVLVAGNPELTVNPALYRDTRYDVSRDLVPLVLIAESPNIIAAHPSVQGTLKEVVARAKSGSPLTVGTPGTGSTHQLALEIMKARTGADLIHVPYKGAGPAVSDALGGQVQLVIAGLPPLLPQIHAGKLRALAVTQLTRTPLAPDIPTVGEVLGPAGKDVIATTWYGLLAPAGTPTEAIKKLQDAALAVLAKPEVRAKLAEMGTDPVGLPGAAFGARIKTELERNTVLVREFKIKVN